MAAPAAIEITLRCSDNLDEFSTRTFTLAPGTDVQIGRASKNAAKPELMVGPGNAYIDSPTISREHAVLTATSPPAACVYITDKGSMHGTMVNNNKLEPQAPRRLENGDVVQFGANVTREQLFYTARQFTFESSLPSYPYGFTVPESSDEDEVDIDDDKSCLPRRGTQTNPLTIDIDDTDELRLGENKELDEVHEARAQVANNDEFDDELGQHAQDTTIPLDTSQHGQGSLPSPVANNLVFYPEDVSATFSAPRRHVFVEDASSEGDLLSDDDVASIYSSDDERVSCVDSGASEADSDESQSDGDMDLAEQDDEEEDADADDDDDDDVAAPLTLDVPSNLLEQQNKQCLLMDVQDHADRQHGYEACRSLANCPVSPERSSAMLVETFRRDSSELGLTAPPAPFANPASATQSATETEPPKLSNVFYSNGGSNGVLCDDFNRPCFDSMEAIPPRPSAPRPMPWAMPYYDSPFSPPAHIPAFSATYSSDFVGNYPGAVEPLTTNPYAAPQPYLAPSDNPWEPSKSSATAPVSGVQTPPPATSSEFSSPPIRRTEVSIREIVEDVTQQPPTPESVTGGLKRKAEVLDEAVEGSDEEPVPAPLSASSVAAQNVPVVEIAEPSHTAIDQRPKKRLRSRLGSAVKTAAAWMVPGVVGAAASVAFLTSVPNDFFVA